MIRMISSGNLEENHLVVTFALKMRKGNVLIAVYLFICMRVIRITKKVLNRIA